MEKKKIKVKKKTKKIYFSKKTLKYPTGYDKESIEALIRELSNNITPNTIKFLKQLLINSDKVPEKAKIIAEGLADENRIKATKAEKLFKILLQQLKVNFEFQKPIYYGPYKSKFYILDFYLPELNICFEVDGGYHGTKEQARKDNIRTNIINKQHIKIFRITNEEVFKTEFCKSFIKRSINI